MIIKDKSKKEITEQENNTNRFNIFSFIETNKKLILILGISIIIFFSFFFVMKNLKQDSVSSKNGLSIKLVGDPTITVNLKTDFLDPGYIATDKTDGDLTDQVQILGIVDFTTPGTYERYYTVQNSRGTVVEIKRTIIVSDKEDNNTLTLTLKGNSTIELKKGTKYVELGYTAHDENGKDLTKEVKVTNNLNINKLGTYTITYTLKVLENTKELIRTIKVVETPKIEEININANLSVNKTEYTNSSIRLTLSITGIGYSYTVLPNQMKSLNKNIIYNVSSNGTYVFNIYDKNGGVKTVEETITNIDKVKPTITCSGEIVDKYTNIKINSSDNLSGISYHVVKSSGNTFKTTKNTYTLSATKDVTVYAYDESGNSSNAKCKITGDLPIVSGNLEVHMFMMGDGDAIVIRSPSYVMVVDGGYSDNRGANFVKYMKGLGITKIDAYLATHYDGDHIGAVPKIFAAFPVTTSYLQTTPPSKGGNEYLDPLRNRSKVVRPDQIIKFGNEMSIKIVGPISMTSACKKGYPCTNTDSINFILTYGKTKFFFAGDYVQSDAIIKRYGKTELSNFDFLKQPHHGLHDYISKQLLSYMKPKYVFVPDGRDHISDKMKGWLSSVGSTVYHTCAKANQTMVAVSDGKTLKIHRDVKASDFKR